jgi:Uma2 family endonuclease
MTSEIIEKPLTSEELGSMYQRMCEDPYFANVPGKLELDLWGRIVMSPASTYHGMIQARLVERLAPLGGQTIVEAAVVTSVGLLVPDVAWASPEFMASHPGESPLTCAPELCIEVVSPSNSRKELSEKVAAYLATGALEAWIVYPQSKRFEYFSSNGLMERAAFAIDLANLFD